jgi:LysR family transcriptional regulator, glycine cleavage system transcriptional activator
VANLQPLQFHKTVPSAAPPDEAQDHARARRIPLLSRGMDIDSLRCFDAVATTLRFRTAAARVHLSPAALSDRIRRLEEDLGARVLNRTTRTVALTDAGQRLLPLTRGVLGLIDRMSSAASGGVALPERYELTVGIRQEEGLSWLCPILDRLARKRPDRTIHLYNGSSEQLVAGVERGQLDAAVVGLRPNSPGLACVTLHERDHVLVGSGANLRHRADARRLTLVDIRPDLPLFQSFLDAHADAQGWSFLHVEYMGSIANIRHRLLEGGGRVAVMPRYFIRADLAKGRLRRLMPRVRLQSERSCLIWRSGHPRHAALAALAQDLRDLPPP